MSYAQPPTVAVEDGYRLELQRVFGSPAFKLDRDRTVLGWDATSRIVHVLWSSEPSRLERWDAATGARIDSVVAAPRHAESVGFVGSAEVVFRWRTTPHRDAFTYERWDLAASVRSERAVPPPWRGPGFFTSDDGSVVLALRPDGWTTCARPDGVAFGEVSRHALDLTPDGARLVTRDTRKRSLSSVWRTDGTLVGAKKKIRLDPPPLGLLLSRTGDALVAGRRHGALTCVDVATGETRWAIVVSARAALALARAPDGATYFALGEDDRLSAVAADGRLRWSVLLRRPRARPFEQTGAARLSVSPDGARLAVAGAGPRLRIVDAASGAERSSVDGHHGSVTCLAVSPDGRLVASGGDGDVRVDDAATGETRHARTVDADAVVSVEFARDGSALRTCGRDGVVRAWSLASGAEATAPTLAHAVEARASPDGARVLAFSQSEVAVWSGPDTRPARWWIEVDPEREPEAFSDWGDAVRAAAFVPDGSRVVVAWDDRAGSWFATLDAATTDRVDEVRRVRGAFVALAETDDGPVLITRPDGALLLTETWAAGRERRLATAPAWYARLSADRRWLVTADYHCVDVWDLRAPVARVVARVDLAPLDDQLTALALSACGDLILVGTRRGCVLTFALGADVP